MKTNTLLALSVVAVGTLFASSAQAGGWSVGVSIGAPVRYSAPVCAPPPPPVYCAPPPVYCPPPRVVCAPPPVVYEPACHHWGWGWGWGHRDYDRRGCDRDDRRYEHRYDGRGDWHGGRR